MRDTIYQTIKIVFKDKLYQAEMMAERSNDGYFTVEFDGLVEVSEIYDVSGNRHEEPKFIGNVTPESLPTALVERIEDMATDVMVNEVASEGGI